MTEQPDETLDMAAVMQKVAGYDAVKKQIKTLNDIQREAKDLLYSLVETAGVPDDKGHLVLELPEPVGDIARLVLQKRVSRVLDQQKAEALLRRKRVYKKCVEMVPVLDEDKIYALVYEGLLTEDDVEAMYPVSESWAFTTPKP